MSIYLMTYVKSCHLNCRKLYKLKLGLQSKLLFRMDLRT